MAIVGKADEIAPGEIKPFEVGGVEVAVANSDGDFYAFSDLCTHEDCPLSEEGEIDGSELTCLCHFSVFDVHTGQVIEGPATESLAVYQISEIDGELDVAI